MCGIVGFTGKQQAAPILLEGLSKLEYRGYDSAGLAVRDGENLAEVVKAKGRLSNLSEKIDGGNALKGTCGIGHTRWATHGEPSIKNAHPHVSGNCTGSGSGEVESEVVGVHNGIIENYQELKDKLSRHGYKFYSDTDTEVAVKLVDYYFKKYKLGPIDAIAKAMVRSRAAANSITTATPSPPTAHGASMPAYRPWRVISSPMASPSAWRPTSASCPSPRAAAATFRASCPFPTVSRATRIERNPIELA